MIRTTYRTTHLACATSTNKLSCTRIPRPPTLRFGRLEPLRVFVRRLLMRGAPAPTLGQRRVDAAQIDLVHDLGWSE